MWKRFFVGLTVLVAGLWVANSSRIAAWIEPVGGGDQCLVLVRKASDPFDRGLLLITVEGRDLLAGVLLLRPQLLCPGSGRSALFVERRGGY